ncbi:hypothetical protein [Lyngbya sp. PCC 8106]|uniref:hypothetical protein n=1 Tax=Lyngbya sp. (strain PCC 8106) TaxID=313612 RepID=UPI0000EAAC34|nr:hypothetical protein [Lyngbya sp. PCC 8106]EAW37120.1 hypothetical protein L8106_19111 [Lyngbya sp. PCC 8106]
MLNKTERAKLIRQIREASGIAQYALEKKLTDEQVIQVSQHLEILSLTKPANHYNRYCQGQKTAEANQKLKEFMNLKNSEIYQAGKWLLDSLSKAGKDRSNSLLQKDLVHKEDYNEGITGLREVVIEQKQGLKQQTDEASQQIKTLESKIDSLRHQLDFIQEYIKNNYGSNDWKKITSDLKKNSQ